jgi:hypothetical protein
MSTAQRNNTNIIIIVIIVIVNIVIIITAIAIFASLLGVSSIYVYQSLNL